MPDRTHLLPRCLPRPARFIFALGLNPPREKTLTTLPPIIQEFRADLSQITRLARTLASAFGSLADDLAGVDEEPQDGAMCAPEMPGPGEPGDGLTTFEVCVRGTDHQPPRTERVRATRYGGDSDSRWVTFYAPGPITVAMYAAEAVESVRRAGAGG